MHGVYSSDMMFIVVFDLDLLLGSDEEREEAEHYISFWLNSIALTGSRAPVVLVGTHKDKVVNASDLKKSNEKLALTNKNIRRAHAMIAEYIRSLKV